MTQKNKLTQFQMRVTEVLQIFKMHGMDVYIPSVVTQIRSIAEELWYPKKHKEAEND